VRRWATVRVRVTLGAVVVVGVCLAAGGAVLVRAHRASLTEDVETAARLRSRDIAATITDGTFPKVLAVPRGEGNLVQVVDAAGRVVAASANLEGDTRINATEPGASGYAVRTVDHLESGEGPFRVIVRRVPSPSGALTVYVAASLASVASSTDSLIRLLLFGLPLLLLVVGATTWVVVGRALRPVESIRREVEVIGAQDLHRRVPEPRAGDEIGRLARTMNAMLARLEDSTERQRRFMADASHELRSPLTGIRSQLEVDLAHPESADWQTTERDVLVDAIRLQRLVDDLLTLATAEASTVDAASREPVDLDEIVLTEARRLRSRTPHRIDTTQVSGGQLDGNRDQLTRAVRNLLDNAARHARTTVTMAVTETDDAVTLVVADDGPGIPLELQRTVFERFARLDDARARDNGGAGLGLAITREVVMAHHGSISIENSPGATFTVTFPIRSPA